MALPGGVFVLFIAFSKHSLPGYIALASGLKSSKLLAN
jgi:hypothetical protein